MKSDRELIDEWLESHTPTKCPPAYLLPVTHRPFGVGGAHMSSLHAVLHEGAIERMDR